MIRRADIIRRRDEILSVAKKHGATDIRIFGSIARGDSGEHSDLDLIVRFEPGRSLMDYGMLVEELQELLGVNVDIVSENALDPRDRFSARVAREAVPL